MINMSSEELIFFSGLLLGLIVGIISFDYQSKSKKKYLLKLYTMIAEILKILRKIFPDRENLEIFEKAGIGLYDERVLQELDFQNPGVKIPQDRYSKIFSENSEDNIVNAERTIIFLKTFAEALIKFQSQEK